MLCAPTAAAAGKGRTRLPTSKTILEQKIKPEESSLKERGPTYVEGDSMTYDEHTKVYTVKGHAKVVMGSETLTADEIRVSQGNQVHARGNVRFRDPSSDIVATEAIMNLATEEGTLSNAKVYALNRSYHLTGSKLKKTLGQDYHAYDATLTTCACGGDKPDWSLGAKEINLHLNGEAEVKGGHFDVLGHSLLPLPEAQYNTNSDRHSGFLSPQTGYSTLGGFRLFEPYFVDLAPNQDVTTAFDVDSLQRVGGLLEYRRLDSPTDYLEFTLSYYNEAIRSQQNRLTDIVDPQIADTHIPINRWGVVGLMHESLTPSLFAYGTATSGSDSLFFREADSLVLSRRYGWNTGNWQAMRDAVSNLGLFQEFDNSYLRLGAVYNQDLIQPQQFALQTLPSLLWSGYQNIDNGLAYLTYNASAVDYWREQGVGGMRGDVNPQLTVPWSWSRYLQGWVTGGADTAAYDVSGHQVDVVPVGGKGQTFNNGLALGPLEQGGLMGRAVPDFDTGVRTTLLGRSDFGWFGLGKVTTLLVPTAEYSYIPKVGQDQFPLFDETDRIEARSLLFYGFSTRFFLQTGGAGPSSQPNANLIARGGVGPSFTTASGQTEEVLRVNVLDAYDTLYSIAPNGAHLSDVDVMATIFPNRMISGSSEIDWSPRGSQRLDAVGFGLQFQPPGQTIPSIYTGRASLGTYLQLFYSYAAANAVLQPPSSVTNAISMVSARGYLGLGDRLGAYFAPDYDINANRLLSDVLGVRLKSPCDCWFFDFAVNQTYYPNNTSFMFQITLGGLGSIGQAPFGLNPFQVAGFLPQAPDQMIRAPFQTGPAMR